MALGGPTYQLSTFVGGYSSFGVGKYLHALFTCRTNINLCCHHEQPFTLFVTWDGWGITDYCDYCLCTGNCIGESFRGLINRLTRWVRIKAQPRLYRSIPIFTTSFRSKIMVLCRTNQQLWFASSQLEWPKCNTFQMVVTQI